MPFYFLRRNSRIDHGGSVAAHRASALLPDRVGRIPLPRRCVAHRECHPFSRHRARHTGIDGPNRDSLHRRAMHLGLPTDVAASSSSKPTEQTRKPCSATLRPPPGYAARAGPLSEDRAGCGGAGRIVESRRPSPHRSRKAPTSSEKTSPCRAMPSRSGPAAARHQRPARTAIVIFGQRATQPSPQHSLRQAPPGAVAKASGWWRRSSTRLALGGRSPGARSRLAQTPYLQRALGPVSVEIQRRIKQALDR